MTENYILVSSNPQLNSYLNRMKHVSNSSRPQSDLRTPARHRSTPDDDRYVNYDRVSDRPPRLVSKFWIEKKSSFRNRSTTSSIGSNNIRKAESR